MSSIDEARALRYLIDSLNDSTDAGIMLDNGRYPSVLFHTEQSCEKATKACLAIIGIIGIKKHEFSDSVRDEIIPSTINLKEDFKSYRRFLIEIESYYISSRYGVDIAGRISLDHYDVNEVKQLVRDSKSYIETCFKFIEEKSGKKIPRNISDLNNYFKEYYSGFITQ